LRSTQDTIEANRETLPASTALWSRIQNVTVHRTDFHYSGVLPLPVAIRHNRTYGWLDRTHINLLTTFTVVVISTKIGDNAAGSQP